MSTKEAILITLAVLFESFAFAYINLAKILQRDFSEENWKNPWTSRIYNGKEVRRIEGVPFIVSIKERLFQSYFEHICGGTYIQPLWVLTAAHCVVEVDLDAPLEDQTATLGWEHRFLLTMGSRYIHSKMSEKRRSVQLMVHPEYDAVTQNFDVGLIKIDTPFVQSARVRLADIGRIFERETKQKVILYGWGRFSEYGEPISKVLRATRLPIINRTLCRRKYILPSYAIHFRDDRVICTGDLRMGSSDACKGDSGGPVVFKGTLVGIISWGGGCGSKRPGVATNVYYHRRFIQQVTRKKLTMRSSFALGKPASLVLVFTCSISVVILQSKGA